MVELERGQEGFLVGPCIYWGLNIPFAVERFFIYSQLFT